MIEYREKSLSMENFISFSHDFLRGKALYFLSFLSFWNPEVVQHLAKKADRKERKLFGSSDSLKMNRF